MLMVWVNVDLFTAFKQILFSIGFFLDFVIFFSYLLIMETKKLFFLLLFLILKNVLIVPSARWTG